MSELKTDAVLVELLGDVSKIKTERTFRRWKKNFLSRWEEFLEQENVCSAEKAYTAFATTMANLVRLVEAVNAHVAKDELSVDRTTVKARNALNEMAKLLTVTIDEEDALIPQTAAAERQRGYTKFHVGAVLVRDNFAEYGRLVGCREILQHMRTTTLVGVADRQHLHEMDNYANKLQKFCDVMADLGLFEVMLKCREFDSDEDAGPNLENILFIDIKTLGFGELCRDDLLQHKLLTATGDSFVEAAATDDAQAKLLTLIKDHPTLGFGSGKTNNQYQNESNVGISELEKVQNMWGVKLKKTPKNVKGQELIFINQMNGEFGELSRQQCLEKGVICDVKDENGKIQLEQSWHELEERAEIMERVRELLKLGIVVDKD